MAEFQRPRGTRDFDPEEMRRRRWVENSMRKAIESFGYSEISTPTFEYTDLFVARSGPQVLEQVYEFEDKGGRSLTLRPELTAPVMRFYHSDLRNSPKPLRISYFGNCFRYERPQKGRYREFWQMGLEYIGKRTPLAIAEVIGAAISALEASGLKGYVVRIGHVALLATILKKYGAHPSRDRDLMIAIDKKDTKGISSLISEICKKDPEGFIKLVTSNYGQESYSLVLDDLEKEFEEIGTHVEEIRKVLMILAGSTADIRLDPSISRGLDYYDGVVFEIDAPNLGAEKQICGGGSYSLSSVFGSEVEGIGFGLGFDRIIVALEQDISIQEVDYGTYLIPMGDAAEVKALGLAEVIRDSGVKCIIETSGRGFKKAISNAISAGCSHLVVMGEEEISKGTVSIKDLITKEQKEIPINEMKEYFLLIQEGK